MKRLVQETHNGAGFVAVSSIPVDGKGTGVFIDVVRAAEHGLAKQYLYLTDESFKTLVMLGLEYFREDIVTEPTK